MKVYLNNLEETKEDALVQMEAYKQKITSYFNKKFCHMELKVGDIVLKEVTLVTKTPSEGKVGPKW